MRKYHRWTGESSAAEAIEERSIPEPNTGCWLWTGQEAGCEKSNSRGYGRMWAKTATGFKKYLAHRFSFETYNGPISAGFFVCHKCDNPTCVNPGHLFLGTAQQNADDCVSKGRSARGEDKPASKLTDSEVLEIFSNNTISNRKIAKLYGVHHSVIGNIKRRLAWKHITLPGAAQG